LSFEAISFVLSSSFVFLQSFRQSTLAVRPQPVGSSLGLLFPSALAGIEGPLFVSVPHLLPFRLQGFATLLAGCSLRSLVDPFSDRQRSWDSPFGAILPPARSNGATRTGPLTVSPAVVPDAKIGSARQAAVSGLIPTEVPFGKRGFNAFTWGDSLGSCPFQGWRQKP
jgi:hypothetical protein